MMRDYQSIMGTCHNLSYMTVDFAAPLSCFCLVYVESVASVVHRISVHLSSVFVHVFLSTVVFIDMRMHVQSACRSGSTTS